MTNTYPKARILVFDSGVGGLTILQEIRQQYPDCHYFYASDNAAFPYGTQAEEALVNRVDRVIHQLQEQTQADIIVIACNTASTIALPRIRERFSQPIIGVVPAIKPAAAMSTSKTVGLLATSGTVSRDYTQELIRSFAADCTVISAGSGELVLLAEQKLRGETIHPEQLHPIVAPFTKNSAIDTMVLACTHFPLVKDELQMALPTVKHWIDSGEAIARRVGHWLKQDSIQAGIVQADANQSPSTSLTEPHTAHKVIDKTLSHKVMANKAMDNTVPANSALFTKQTAEVDALTPALARFGLHHVSIIPDIDHLSPAITTEAIATETMK